MNIEQQSIRERPRLQIDERLGFILAVVAGALSSIAAGGWMILLSDITQLKSTFEAGEAQRFAKLGQVEGVIRTIQDKIETLTGANGKLRMLEDKLDSATGKFLQVEAAIKLNSVESLETTFAWICWKRSSAEASTNRGGALRQASVQWTTHEKRESGGKRTVRNDDKRQECTIACADDSHQRHAPACVKKCSMTRNIDDDRKCRRRIGDT